GQPLNTTAVEGNSATFTIQLGRALGASYQWLRNGTNIPNATNASYFLAPVALPDSGSTFRCYVFNSYGNTNSSTATLTVTADLTRPSITSIGSLGDPGILTVIFSEPVAEASATQATNYVIASGITVLSAALGTDKR